MRIAFESAGAHHDADLRRLLATNPMDGEISLAFEREPSYFLASPVQGTFHDVFVARHVPTGEIVGVATRAVRRGYLNGEEVDVGYLADLRLAAPHRGGLAIARGYRELARRHRDGRARLYYTVIAEGNRAALDTIASGRAGLPRYREMGRLSFPAVNLRRRLPEPDAGVEIARGTRASLPEIVDCLNRNHRRRQFAPAYRGEDVGGPAFRGFDVGDFYVARRGGRVVGVVGRWDQGAYKQTVVKAYGRRLRWLRPIYNGGARLLGWPRYPAPGSTLRSLFAAFVAVDGDDAVVLGALLRRLHNDHVGGGFHYFVIGLHERDPLAAALDGFSCTPFHARLFAVHFDDGAEAFAALDGRVPYVEPARL